MIRDENADAAELWAYVVRKLGHEPVCEDDGPAPDVLLLDANGGESLEAARRGRERDAAVPIVFVSIYPESEPFRALDPVAYLVKPFALGKLGQALEAALAARNIP